MLGLTQSQFDLLTMLIAEPPCDGREHDGVTVSQWLSAQVLVTQGRLVLIDCGRCGGLHGYATIAGKKAHALYTFMRNHDLR
jgi:hypothetical protein